MKTTNLFPHLSQKHTIQYTQATREEILAAGNPTQKMHITEHYWSTHRLDSIWLEEQTVGGNYWWSNTVEKQGFKKLVKCLTQGKTSQVENTFLFLLCDNVVPAPEDLKG